ncbi:MAG: PLP-dependent aspartate aminotransferase family protein [Deltaproteobacteria bacterium]|jgi:cystathionine gamma-synthase|nr:PLP-dependent aspartate aminotransferase family protein [Deltaproteobacteria bacterium]
MKIDSICVRGAKDLNDRTGAVSVPIYQSATFSHPGVGASTGYDYARVQNPTREPLERLVASLENGRECCAFASGMAAMDALMWLVPPGARMLATSDLYGGSVRLFNELAVRAGLRVDYLDTGDRDRVRAALGPDVKAVFAETPSNPMMHVTDLKALRETVGPEVMVIVDNTFLTPCLMRPLDLGADLVIHSGTKYLGGHNDTLSGFVVTNSPELAERLRYVTKTVGTGLSPFDSFMVIRGLKTLHLRVARAQATAMETALWLRRHPKVRKVYYPGLPEHPGHEISLRQASGFGAMISFEVESSAAAEKALEGVKFILYAESLGGTETLITYPCLQTHADVSPEKREALGITDRLLRLSVGVEASEDILADLEQALA